MSNNLKNKIIKLAYDRPELRSSLLPLVMSNEKTTGVLKSASKGSLAHSMMEYHKSLHRDLMNALEKQIERSSHIFIKRDKVSWNQGILKVVSEDALDFQIWVSVLAVPSKTTTWHVDTKVEVSPTASPADLLSRELPLEEFSETFPTNVSTSRIIQIVTSAYQRSLGR